MSTLFLRAKTKQAKIAKNRAESERERYIYKEYEALDLGMWGSDDHETPDSGLGDDHDNGKGRVKWAKEKSLQSPRFIAIS